MKLLIAKHAGYFYILMSWIVTVGPATLNGQEAPSIKGILKDQKSNEPVSYAAVSLHDACDSTFIAGTLSDSEGEFVIHPEFSGKGYLKVNFVGYQPDIMDIDIESNGRYDVGTIFLEEKQYNIKEAVITGDRIKARDDADRTTYFVNKKMYDASGTGVDILKHIPGVQVDIMQNVFLEGSPDILFLVDGRERDKSFISQLNANQIDKVEIMSVPGSKYDADITGVINIILKKEKKTGINGHAYAEIPLRKSEIYCFPAYSFNMGFKKFNLFTSYNGDIRYFNITESYRRMLENNTGITEIRNNSYFKQKDWSHRFHFGFDYFLNNKNQFNFYSFYNPYSCYDAGRTEIQTYNNDVLHEDRSVDKKDRDLTHMSFYSLYYKHMFTKPGREITFDINYFDFKSNRTISYLNYTVSGNNIDDQITTLKPTQNTASIKIDFTSPLTAKIKLNAGTKTLFNMRGNSLAENYNHEERIYAAYGSIIYTVSKFDVNAGVRAEKSVTGLSDSFTNDIFALMPYAAISYKITPKQNIKIAYRRKITRPMLNQLDPYAYTYDPFTRYRGNPDLEPEFHENVFMDHSIRFGNNYLSNRIFYSHSVNVIDNLSFLNDTTILETGARNLGNMNYFGYQLTGSLTLLKSFSMNPYFKIFGVHSVPDDLAVQYHVSKKHKVAFESGLSAMVSFKYDITASLFFQYNSAKYDMQSKSLKGALYFISLDKTFYQKLKIGAMACVPFTKSFNDREVFISGENFQYHTNRDLHLTEFPVMFKLGYQFSSGKKIHKIDRDKEVINTDLNSNY